MRVSIKDSVRSAPNRALSQKRETNWGERRAGRAIHFITALLVVMCFGSQARAAISAPSTSIAGNYTVSWSTPLGCSTMYVYGFPIQTCYKMYETVNGGPNNGGSITDYATSGTSRTYTNKPFGVYTYVIEKSITGYPATPTYLIQEGPATTQVGVGGPPPLIVPTFSEVGPYSGGFPPIPAYYILGWTVSFAFVGGCELETSTYAHPPNGTPTLVYVSRVAPLPTTHSVIIDNPIPNTDYVYYQIKCTGPGGVATANGVFQF